MKPDISTEEDVRHLVDQFYDRVRRDALLAPIFDEVARVNWTEHLPLLYSFWNFVLFRRGKYQGAPYPKHAVLPVNRWHFQRWLQLFNETMDALFEGSKAREAKGLAASIADTFQRRMGLLDPFRLSLSSKT